MKSTCCISPFNLDNVQRKTYGLPRSHAFSRVWRWLHISLLRIQVGSLSFFYVFWDWPATGHFIVNFHSLDLDKNRSQFVKQRTERVELQFSLPRSRF